MAWKIPLFKTYSDKQDVDAVASVILRGTYWAIGPEIEEFEKKIAQFVGMEYSAAFNSGTSALHTLLLAHGVTGKEIIVPSFTFIATASATILAGATPVFAESESDTFGLDAEDVARRITKNTRAVIQLHYGGFPGRDTEKLRKICDDEGLLFIEDAAESLGASIRGKMVGSFGHSSMFSFCQNKVLSTGEGGMLLTESEKIFERAKLLRSHGRVELAQDYFASVGDNDYVEAGYNFRMPTVLAALGLSQFRKIQKVIELRRKYGHYLSERLSKISEITVPKELEGHFQVYQMYAIQLPDNETRDALQAHLSENGIMSKVYFNPVHLKAIYARKYGCKEGDLPKTEALSGRILSLPLFPSMTFEDLDFMLRTIMGFFDNRK